MICDRKDYSRVYRTEIRVPGVDQILYLRECDNFDAKGFPHSVTEIQYDPEGNLVEKSVYRIVKIDLSPVIPDEVFAFDPPEDYEVRDRRPLDKQPKNVSYLKTEDVEKAISQVNEAFQKKDLNVLKGFLKHKSWRVRNSTLALVTGVAEGKELRQIVESATKDRDGEVRKHAEQILKRLQKQKIY
jgi:hypothetical protein